MIAYPSTTLRSAGCVLTLLASGFLAAKSLKAQPPARDFPFRTLEGRALEFHYNRNWRHYYWREDFTMLVRDDAGKVHRVISREPTPWTDYRLGTTFTGLTVDWKRQPRVQIIGVQGVDRQPAEFYDLKLDPQATVTAFIVRVQQEGKTAPEWRDFFINNWFHKWGAEADVKMLPFYAKQGPNYVVYGYVGTIAAPFDAEGRKVLRKYEGEYGGIIYRGQVVKAHNDVGHEVRLINLMGRHKKSLKYEVFHGKTDGLVKLDGKAPPKK